MAANAVRLLPSMKAWFCGQALPKRGGCLDKVGIVTGLRPVERGFEQPRISEAMRSAVALDLVGVYGQNFGYGEIVRHSASFL